MLQQHDRVAVFSDVHWGKGRDSSTKLEISERFVHWLAEELSVHGIKAAVFCGDWFDNRHSLNVNTINKAYESLRMLCSVAEVYAIVGNHDCHFKNTNRVHSLTQFRDIPNLTLVEQAADIRMANGKRALMCPWQWDVESALLSGEYYDYLFGHWELNGAALNGMVSTGSAYGLRDLLKLAPRVLAGHYHINKEYPFDNGTVWTLGCPYELDWGDVGNPKGFYVLDTRTDRVEFHENDASPKHVKLHLSRLKNGTQKVSRSMLEGNYVKIVVDQDYSYEEITRLMAAFQKASPLQIDPPDFVFSFSKSLLDGVNVTDRKEINISKLDYVMNFIDGIEPADGQTIDKVELKRLIGLYYAQAESGQAEVEQ